MAAKPVPAVISGEIMGITFPPGKGGAECGQISILVNPKHDYTTNAKTWNAPLIKELHKIEEEGYTGRYIELDITTKPGVWKGNPVTYRDLVGIISTAEAPKPQAVAAVATTTAAPMAYQATHDAKEQRIIREVAVKAAALLESTGLLPTPEAKADVAEWTEFIDDLIWQRNAATHELTPADLSDDGEISGLDEVHDDQEV